MAKIIGAKKVMTFKEINFDGLIGPTHNYGGLSEGNVASQKNIDQVSNPKMAALQGLQKMELLLDEGLHQGIFLPHERPYLKILKDLGYSGSGAEIINDVSSLNYDKNTLKLLKNYDCMYVLTHSKKTPKTMQNNPSYKNVLLDIYDFFEKKIEIIREAGIMHNKIILDPGIGFGKNLKHNITLIKNVSIFHSLGLPIMLGLSRKRFIKDISKENDTKNRIGGTISSCIQAYLQGVQILRVHDVKEINQAFKVFKELQN